MERNESASGTISILLVYYLAVVYLLIISTALLQGCGLAYVSLAMFAVLFTLGTIAGICR